MSLQTILTEIEKLKLELDSYHPIPNDRLQKINYKFRLEWNYHSNKMEGGTLTFEETRSVMMEQLDVRGKPLRDVMEMRGHDEVIKNIQKIGRGEVRITENRIKEIHKAIIFDETDMPGRFKNRNNYIYNYQGERFDFTPEEDTIAATNSLSNWLDNELKAINKKKSKKSIPEIAFEYHLRFLTIHPFLDGNGRTGRILMNLILIAHGYPPIIIRTEEKELYGKHIAHAQQYEENPVPLYEMLGNLLIRSFEICLKGVKGEDIFEIEDWEKRLQLLEYQAVNGNNNLLKSREVINLTTINSILPFIEYADTKFSVFNKFYSNFSKKMSLKVGLQNIPRTIIDLSKTIEILKKGNLPEMLSEMSLNLKWTEFKVFGKKVEDINIEILFLFKNQGYLIKQIGANSSTIEKQYNETLSQEEIKNFINAIGSSITEDIENKLKEP
jgi:fido (protein-threonine AMPylation protein)